MNFTEEDSIKLIFGLKIKQLRQAKELSQQELADAVGMAVSYINEIEKGKKYPKPDKINGLAKELGTTYENLVSLKVNKALAPAIEIINSPIFKEFPLDMFGIDSSKLLSMIVEAPIKVNAFINTLAEIARNYNLKQENFYFAALRSYQEMQNNYFEDIEKKVEEFIKEFDFDPTPPINADQLISILEDKYKYIIDREEITNNPKLNGFRSILVPGEENRFYMNGNLNRTQRRFLLAKEIGFNYMKIKERSYTSSWVKVTTFEQVLNNFKASYFANALLINKGLFLTDLEAYFSKEKWDGEALVDLMLKYYVSPETFLHRLTNLLPEYFGLSSMFFLRFNDSETPNKYYLTKELHLSGKHNPHANQVNEHYCRRWISITMLQQTKQLSQSGNYIRPLAGIQRSQYVDSKNEYLCITLARPLNRKPHLSSSVTIGFLVNNDLKKRIKFWNDENIPLKQVNESCERCSLTDCEVRAAQPVIHKKKTETDTLEAELNAFMSRIKQLQEN